MKLRIFLPTLVFLLTHSMVYAAVPSNQQLLEMLKKQQSQIEALQKKLNEMTGKVEQNDEKIEASASVIEENLSMASVSQTKIGAYGELHYSNFDQSNAGNEERIDFHRFVLFFDHEFSDSIRFYSELELEHALSGDNQVGEVEIEQAYIEMDLSAESNLKAGAFLIPVGIINETHEPTTFYAVERNPIEKNIIPATWWEAGAAITTRFTDGLSADFAIHSGLNVSLQGDNSYLIRGGRQKVSEANANSLAYTARLKYSAIPGLELAASYQYQSDLTQGQQNASANLLTSHVAYQYNDFALRALFATWNINSNEAKLLGRDKQKGYYIEPSYKINESFGLFARYNVWDNSAGNTIKTEKKQSNIGFNYWPDEKVVFKFDLENRSGSQKGNGFNLGMGYQF